MLIIVIETIETNNSFVFAGLALGSIAGPVPSFVAGFAPNSITSSDPGFVASSALSSVKGFTLGFITIRAPGATAGCIAFVVIDLKTSFFYSKQVTTKDYINFKLYMKEMIWIRAILFNKTIDAWNYILSIPNEIYQA